MKYRLIFIVLSLLFWVGCYEEEPLTPTEGLEFKYTVPQGDHDYDARIVDWYEKNGFYILYKFDPKDIYFDISYWSGSLFDSLRGNWMSGIASSVAEEEYVDRQLQLVEDVFLNFYSDTVLSNWMPMKILLCSKLEKNKNSIEAISGLDLIAVKYGSSEIEDLLADETKLIKFKNNMHMLFFQRIIDQKKLVAPKEFAELSEYGMKVDKKDMFKLGFIENNYGMEMNVSADFMSYVKAVFSYSYDELNAEMGEGDYTVVGILNPNKDVNGLIRRKYDVLINYFRETLHMDLQAIGNYRKP